MEFKGTKGKWTTFYDDFDGYGVRLVEEGFSFGMVQIATNIGQGESEGYADAKLISKAPEMLEMLQWVLKSGKLSEYDTEKVTELIKEATTI